MRRLGRIGNYISSKIGKAIGDYNMIEDGDRILVAVSGGKDSLSLLKLLNERKKWAPIKYELVAMHVQTDYRCAGCVHTAALKKFFKDNKIAYRFSKIKVRGEDNSVSCFWCSWNRRKALFLAAAKLGCRKIAFGHHKDDIIETLLLNIFYQGEFAAMNPAQKLFRGKITIIRPLCYVEESALKKYSILSGFPSQMCRCPNSGLSKRRMMKNFISKAEKDCRNVKTNIFRSISRVRKDYIDIRA